MGTTLLDEYSLLHFATGIIARHWAVGFWLFVLIHSVFEYLENTPTGMRFITTYFTLWPGGKSSPDTLLNQVGDTITAGLGWLAADWLLLTKPTL